MRHLDEAILEDWLEGRVQSLELDRYIRTHIRKCAYCRHLLNNVKTKHKTKPVLPSVDSEKLYEKMKHLISKQPVVYKPANPLSVQPGQMCLLKRIPYSTPLDLLPKVLIFGKTREDGEVVFYGCLTSEMTQAAGPYDLVLDSAHYNLNYDIMIECWNFTRFYAETIASCAESLPDEILDVCGALYYSFFTGEKSEIDLPEGTKTGPELKEFDIRTSFQQQELDKLVPYTIWFMDRREEIQRQRLCEQIFARRQRKEYEYALAAESPKKVRVPRLLKLEQYNRYLRAVAEQAADWDDPDFILKELKPLLKKIPVTRLHKDTIRLLKETFQFPNQKRVVALFNSRKTEPALYIMLKDCIGKQGIVWQIYPKQGRIEASSSGDWVEQKVLARRLFEQRFGRTSARLKVRLPEERVGGESAGLAIYIALAAKQGLRRSIVATGRLDEKGNVQRVEAIKDKVLAVCQELQGNPLVLVPSGNRRELEPFLEDKGFQGLDVRYLSTLDDIPWGDILEKAPPTRISEPKKKIEQSDINELEQLDKYYNHIRGYELAETLKSQMDEGSTLPEVKLQLEFYLARFLTHLGIADRATKIYRHIFRCLESRKSIRENLPSERLLNLYQSAVVPLVDLYEYQTARELLCKAEELLEEMRTTTIEKAKYYGTYAQYALSIEDFAQARSYAQKAIELHTDPPEQIRPFHYAINACLHEWERDPSRRSLENRVCDFLKSSEDLMRQIEKGKDDKVRKVNRTFRSYYKGKLLVLQGKTELAREELKLSQQYARSLSMNWIEALAKMYEARVIGKEKEKDTAEGLLKQSFEILEGSGKTTLKLLALLPACRLYLDAGDGRLLKGYLDSLLEEGKLSKELRILCKDAAKRLNEDTVTKLYFYVHNTNA